MSGLSMWPHPDQVLSLASWWCQAIYFFVVVLLFVSKKMPDFDFTSVMSLTSLISFRGGWDPLTSGKFHVSIRAVHIV